MRVLVTGATGFLGHHVVERLASEGHEPVALVRPTSDARRLRALGVATVTGSLDDEASLRPALSGAEAVVHCAGGGRAGGGADLFQQNAGTTAALLRASEAHAPGLRRFVLISSLAAQGPSGEGGARPDDAPSRPRSDYGRSKAEAERLVRAASGRLPATILRPPAIYGPGDDRWLGLFRAARRGVVPAPGRRLRSSLVSAADCAGAVAAIVGREHPSGRAYSVAEGAALSWAQIGQAAARAVGARAVVVPVPRALLWALGAASEVASAVRKKPSFFSLDKAADATAGSWECDPEPLRRELGWTPSLAFDRGGAEQTARWYREQGLLG